MSGVHEDERTALLAAVNGQKEFDLPGLRGFWRRDQYHIESHARVIGSYELHFRAWVMDPRPTIGDLSIEHYDALAAALRAPALSSIPNEAK